MSDTKSSGWKILALFLLMPFEVLWYGFVLVKLWSWFAVPIFGFRTLRIPEAIGVSLMTHFLTSSSNDAKAQHDTFEAIGLAIAIPLFGLFYGWIIHLFL